MAEVKTIDLAHAIPGADGKDVTAISFRMRLRVKDLEHLPEVDNSLTEEQAAAVKIKPKDMLPLIASLSGLPLASVGEIDMQDDMPKVMAALANFIEAMSPQTGDSSSGA